MRALLNPEPHLPGNRFNDGKCDPAGRFLAGSMDNAEVEATGSLYSLDPDGSLKTLITGTRISNGLTWSPDYRTFYFIDTPTRTVMAYDYDLATGDIANPRPAISVPPELGWPDGMTSDSEGMLWVAMWGGAKLTRWDPATGHLLAADPLPGPQCLLLRLWRPGPDRPVCHLRPQGYDCRTIGKISPLRRPVPHPHDHPGNANLRIWQVGADLCVRPFSAAIVHPFAAAIVRPDLLL